MAEHYSRGLRRPLIRGLICRPMRGRARVETLAGPGVSRMGSV